MKKLLFILLLFAFSQVQAQNTSNILKALNFRSAEYVELSKSQELVFEKLITQLNKDKIYNIVSIDSCGKYMNGILDFNEEPNDENIDQPMPLQIVYKKTINFNIDSAESYLIKFKLDNCLHGNARYQDFAFFTSINNKVIPNKSLTENLKNKFHQYVISKFNEEDRFCYNSKKHNYVFTDGLDITKVKDNIVYGEYVLYGANAPNCCPEYGGNFEYNMLARKIQFKNEYYNPFYQDEKTNNSNKSKLGYYKIVTNKAFFYSEPQEATKKSSYLIKDNNVNIIIVKGKFGYAEYQNTQGKTTKGWLKLSELTSSTITAEDSQAVAIAKMQKEEQVRQQKAFLEQQRIAELVKKAEQERLVKESEETKKKELLNRKYVYRSMPFNSTNDTGKVVVDINVDSLGNVVYAKYQPIGSTTSNIELIKLSEKAALKTKFNAVSSMEVQKSTIIYNFY